MEKVVYFSYTQFFPFNSAYNHWIPANIMCVMVVKTEIMPKMKQPRETLLRGCLLISKKFNFLQFVAGMLH